MPNGKGLEVGQEGFSTRRVERRQSPTDSCVRFHARALNSTLCSSQGKEEESRDMGARSLCSPSQHGCPQIIES